jgi:cell division inhibitor SepF
MAASFLKKTMAYLGLVDDEYDEYDEYDGYEDRSPRSYQPAATRLDTRTPDVVDEEPPAVPERPLPPPVGRIRPLPREGVPAAPVAAAPRAASASVRPIGNDALAASAKVHVVAPARFGDAKEIADVLKANRPVIVNLQVADRDLQRRMIDFCSGVTYALSGDMEKVADQVFLLAPTNVKLSDEERQRLQERGFGRS